MDWLEASIVFVLGWFGRKLKRFAESVLEALWVLATCGPPFRRYLLASLYVAFLDRAEEMRDSGRLKGAELERIRRFILWINPKVKAWMERVGPGSPGWPRRSQGGDGDGPLTPTSS